MKEHLDSILEAVMLAVAEPDAGEREQLLMAVAFAVRMMRDRAALGEEIGGCTFCDRMPAYYAAYVETPETVARYA